jgi:hypothetical protein
MQIVRILKKYKDLILAILLVLNLIAWGINHLGGRIVVAQITPAEGPPGAIAPGLRIGYERREFKVGGIYILRYIGKQEDGSHLFAIGRD